MKNTLSRRGFLGRAAAAVAAPYVLTSRALGGAEKAPASDRIACGHIGVGGMGSGHLRGVVGRRDAAAVAVCDVDEQRLARAHETAGTTARAFRDFRQLLDQPDIDAVFIASPDHWHALHTILACKAGKDVYVQKPLCVTILEGRAMVTAARRYGRIVQFGAQGRSQSGGRHSAQYVRNGHCGRVREVRCWHYPNPTRGPAKPQPVPPHLDYDLWLGPLPYFPYHSSTCHGSFRWLLCSGGGNIRDRGAHIFSIVTWAMNVDSTGPVSIVGTGEVPDGLYDVPRTMNVTYEFRDPDWTLHWDQPGEPHALADDPARPPAYGCYFVGDRDSLVVGNCDGVRADRRVLFEPGANEVRLYRSDDHPGNFLECVRTRRLPISDVEIGHRVTSLCILGNLAYSIGRPLRWDPAREEFIGDDEANRLRHYPYREPWRLED